MPISTIDQTMTENNVLTYIRHLLIPIQETPHTERSDYDNGRVDALRSIYRYVIGMEIDRTVRERMALAKRATASVAPLEPEPIGET